MLHYIIEDLEELLHVHDVDVHGGRERHHGRLLWENKKGGMNKGGMKKGGGEFTFRFAFVELILVSWICCFPRSSFPLFVLPTPPRGPRTVCLISTRG